tara:strand:+ start:148 stop:435 length:288 start_codon:yes stop_codon:yes gene_type:complete
MTNPYQERIAGMGREVYDSMLSALASGRWADGRILSAAQRQHTMGAVIAWGELNLQPHERVGYIDKGHKAGDACDDPAPLRWLTDDASASTGEQS